MNRIRQRLTAAAWKLREQFDRRPFDAGFYLSTYSDVAAAVAEGRCTPFQHYVLYGRGEGRAAVRTEAAPAVSLESSPRTSIVFLELTSRCNLKCVYCAVSQPTYNGIDLPLEGLDNFIGQMKERRVEIVTMNGHGESTIVKQWDTYADRLIDAGFRLHMTTNFAKRMSEAEIATLSRFEYILVSLDTVNGELLAKLRRGARIEQILDNIAALQRFAAARNRKPEIAISCVMTDIAAPTVGELVDALLDLGVTTFRFGDLSEYAPIPGEIVPRHLTAIAPAMLPAVRKTFRAAVQRIEAAGGKSFIDAPIASFLLQDDAEVGEQERSTPLGSKAVEKSVHFTPIAAKQTRDCLDPWNTAFVNADATVRPCCFFEEKFGSLQEGTLSEIVSNEAFTKLRAELLSGELRANCAGCAARPSISVEEFHRKVAQYVS